MAPPTPLATLGEEIQDPDEGIYLYYLSYPLPHLHQTNPTQPVT